MTFTFHRWVRFGIAAALTDTALPAGGGPRAKVTVQPNLSATVPVFAGTVAQPSAQLAAFGPGDVTGIDTRQIVRTFPVPGTTDFESTYLAHVELDRPDLPWLFTPVAAGTDQLLRPWIALAVVRHREGVTLEPSTPLPVLSIADGAAGELPALGDLARWAHVQVAGTPDSDLQAIAASEPHRIVSRLICPRQLQPNTAYLACLVPTYDAGVAAGLGQEVADTAALGDAWTATTTSIRLPVYHHWAFTTGAAGDFRSLVTRLQAHTAPATVGTRPLDISQPGFSVPDLAAGTTVSLGGALRVSDPVAAPASADLAARLQPVLNAPATLGPPIYGRWHAGATSVTLGTAPLGWLEALNLDPRHRVAAGLGTLVVQQRQEDLMAAVWEQLGEILEANQRLRQAQLSIAAAERVVARHLAVQPAGALLAIAGPAVARIRAAPGVTVWRRVVESCLPIAALSGAFRRISRAHGPLERRIAHRARASLGDVMPPPSIDAPAVVERLAAGTLDAPAPRPPDGALVAPDALLPPIRRRPPFPRREPVTAPAPLAELWPALSTLRARATAAPCTPLEVGPLAQTVRGAITPDIAIPPRVRAQLQLPANVQLSSRLDPVMAAPVIPTPMVGPLLELGQDLLLPGLADLPPNTLTLVQPNGELIESFFVGLNHEMGRELLWRGFPTDQRGTVFARFWDRRGAVPDANAPADDITSIAGWSRTSALGTHLTRAAGDIVVLLIRGDLLQRYPRATIFLQQARWQRDAGDIVYEDRTARRAPEPVADDASWARHGRFPAFTGRTGADTAFIGFVLPKGAVIGLDPLDLPKDADDADAGWYVVFQEQPTEPRFGPAAPAPTTRNSEQLAAALLRPAFRLFVHGSDLVER